jgi:pimeloyl-ACP methyl ester carboxylesterase
MTEQEESAALGSGAVAERAAVIEYEFIARPADVPTEYEAPVSVSLRFLVLKAIDGSRVEAALWQPGDRLVTATTLVIDVHGSGGTFHGPPNGFLSKELAINGYGVLGINTRQSGTRVNTDNFLDARRDLEAAAYTARALGYRTLVLHGHSLGNIQVQFYAATNWEKDIKAVILTGMFGNLPWKSRHLLVQDEERFAALREAALKALSEGKEDELLPGGMRRTGGQAEPLGARHFLTYRASESSTADGTYWIARIPYPVLLVRDEGDMIVQSFEPYMLLAAARAYGSLVPRIKYVLLPNHRGPNPDGHFFRDNRGPLAGTIIAWLREQRL